MNSDDFRIFLDSFTKTMYDTLNIKGGEYSSSLDRLDNFKRGSALTDTDPRKVALIYLSKHYDAVASYVRDPTRASSEPIRGRLIDLANYCVLLAALIEETDYARRDVGGDIRDKASHAERYPDSGHLVGGGGLAAAVTNRRNSRDQGLDV